MLTRQKLKDYFLHLKTHKLRVIFRLLFILAGGWLLVRAGYSFHPNFGSHAFPVTQSAYFFRFYTGNTTSLVSFLAGGFLVISGCSLLIFTHLEERARLPWKILNAFFCILIFGFLVDHALYLLNMVHPDEWLIGDWLINYQGGFVRRGLIGEILLGLSRASGVSYVPMVVMLQLGLYLAILINTWRLAVKAPISPLTALLVYSPAFLLFPVLDPQGAFRKEILLLALLSFICANLASSEKTRRPWVLPAAVGLACVFLVLNHEMLTPYLLYLVGAVVISERGFSKTARNTLIAILPSIVITALLILFGRGDSQAVAAICASLQAGSPISCTTHGAISSLGENVAIAHRFVMLHTGEETRLVYLIPALLSTIPLVILLVKKQVREWMNWKMLAWMLVLVSVSIIATLPLFWVAADYGRLIYIHIGCLSLLALLLLSKIPKETFHLKPLDLLLWGLFFLYGYGWRLIHYDALMENAFPILPWIIAIFT